MSMMFDYSHLEPYFDSVTRNEALLIKSSWRAFYDNPDAFKDTELSSIIAEWLKEELTHWEIDEYGEFSRIRYHYVYGYGIDAKHLEYGIVKATDEDNAESIASGKIPSKCRIYTIRKVEE